MYRKTVFGGILCSLVLGQCGAERTTRQDLEGKPLKLADTNMARIGSKEDIEMRKTNAQKETAWHGVGEKPGLWVFRIEKFEPVAVDETSYGKFYKGDSYIVLKVIKSPKSDGLVRDIYFWLGAESTADEEGAAAIKTVELDDYFGGSPTQHREVQGGESDDFIALFDSTPTGFTYLEGGILSAFNPADPAAYKKKLFIVRRTNGKTLVQEVPMIVSSLNQGDCFVLDAGLEIRRWCGKTASGFESYDSGQLAEKMEDYRGNAKDDKFKAISVKHETDVQGNPSDKWWELFGSKHSTEEIPKDYDPVVLRGKPNGEGVLYVLHQDDEHDGVAKGKIGQMTLTEVAKGDLRKDQLVEDDVNIVDTGAELFVWIGKGANAVERRNAMDTAILYLKTNNMPRTTSIHVFKQGQEITNSYWLKMFDN